MARLPAGNGDPKDPPEKTTGQGDPHVDVPTDLPDIALLGVSHHTAPVGMREKLAFTKDEIGAALSDFRKSPHVQEALILSTCNRVEIILAADNPGNALETAFTTLCEAKALPPRDLKPACYRLAGEAAVRHVFRVAASLDSMMIGEPQILGQVKEAFKIAVAQNSTGVMVNRLMHKAFSTAKRVRSETGIGGNAVSISHAAVALAKKIFDTLNGKTILLVGAGEMAELAVEQIMRHTNVTLLVANRTFAAGVALARRFHGQAIHLEEIGETLKIADIIISSTGSPHFVITRGHVRPIMRSRKNRPLFFIDIAVPRDIDPAVNQLANAYVYDIDDLQGVINENINARRAESVKAEGIVNEAVVKFLAWRQGLDVVPTIVALRKKLEDIAAGELAKTLHLLSHLCQEDREAIERMAGSMVKKILHDPALFLKNPGSHRNKSLYLDITRNLFHLDA